MKIRSLLITATIVLAACADPVTPGAGPAQHPVGADQVVLRIDIEGGFVRADVHLTSIPGFSLFGDGTVVTTGAQIEIYPGPALPPLVATPLSEDGIRSLLRAATDAGLGEDHDLSGLGSVPIADAGTTVFTMSAQGRTTVTKIYALMELGERPPGMSQGEFDLRTKLLRFQSQIGDLRSLLPDGSVGADRPFTPAGLRMVIRDYRPTADLPQADVDWPLAPSLARFGEPIEADDARCGAVTGTDLAALLPLATSANQLTPWVSGGDRYAITFRPLLPDEAGC